MNNFQSLLKCYSESHQHPINKKLHLIGVPCLLFSILIFFSWIHITMPGIFDMHSSWLFGTTLILYYLRLDMQLALLLGAILLPCTLLANFISTTWLSLPLFCIFFAIGWILQLIGHFLEGKQPAVVNTIQVLLTLPLITLADILYQRGFRQDLQIL
jgi:uncharacterized membrane protein YGL010W